MKTTKTTIMSKDYLVYSLNKPKIIILLHARTHARTHAHTHTLTRTHTHTLIHTNQIIYVPITADDLNSEEDFVIIVFIT